MSLQILINGLATGSVYALIATGFALIFNVLKFSNFSHGATMTAAAFVAYFLVSSKGMGLTATLAAAAAAGAVIALFGEFFGSRRITLNHSSPTYFFVSSITLGTLYEGLVTIKVGSNFYNFPGFFKNSTIKVGSLVISASDAMMCIISLAALVILGYVIQKTRLGRALRAVSFDRDTAQLMGIDSTRIIQLTFCHLRLVGRCGRRVPGYQIYIVSHAGKPGRQGLHRLGHRWSGQPDGRHHRRGAAGPY